MHIYMDDNVLILMVAHVIIIYPALKSVVQQQQQLVLNCAEKTFI